MTLSDLQPFVQVVGPIGPSGLVAAVLPTQLQPTTPTTLILNRVSLSDPLRRLMNGQTTVLPLPLTAGSAASIAGQQQLPKTTGGQVETRVLDEARKRLLAKNNVSIFQKSKSSSSGGGAREEGGGQEELAAHLQVAKASQRGQGPPAVPPLPLKIPQPPAPRPSNPAGGVQPFQAGLHSLAPVPSQAMYRLSQQAGGGKALARSFSSLHVRPSTSGEHPGAQGGDKRWESTTTTSRGDVSTRTEDRITSSVPSGHPGLPSGLMRMASSVIPASKSPTKITPRTEAKHVIAASQCESVEVRRARLDLLFQAPPSAASPASAPPRGLEEDPPVPTPRVSLHVPTYLPTYYVKCSLYLIFIFFSYLKGQGHEIRKVFLYILN